MNTISVAILREGQGQVRDGMGGYTDAGPQPIPGSPFTCRLYRRRPAYNRNEGDAGTTTLDNQRILSVIDPNAPIEIGDIADIPACPQTRNRPERVTIQFVRPYPTGLQCDIESGATPQAEDSSNG